MTLDKHAISLTVTLIIFTVIFSAFLFAEKNGYESLTGKMMIFAEGIYLFHTETDTLKLYVVAPGLMEESDFPLVDEEQYIIKGFSISGGFLVYGLATADGQQYYDNNGKKLLMVSGSPELSYRVDPRRCISCRLCIPNCPVGAIRMVRGSAVIDQEKCISCGICRDGNVRTYRGCPVEAIQAE